MYLTDDHSGRTVSRMAQRGWIGNLDAIAHSKPVRVTAALTYLFIAWSLWCSIWLYVLLGRFALAFMPGTRRLRYRGRRSVMRATPRWPRWAR